MTRRHSSDIARAGELTRQGVPQKEIAADIGCSTKQIQHWTRDPRYAHLLERHEPGSLEHRRSILLAALDSGNLSERLRAVELLERLGVNEKPQGNGRIVVLVGPKPEEIEEQKAKGAKIIDNRKPDVTS